MTSAPITWIALTAMCTAAQEEQAPPRLDGVEAVRESAVGNNVLLVILDDVGLDAVGCYPGANDDAITPCIDRISREGLRFETVWSYPACSPTRSTILTGKYGFRTGIGSIVKVNNDDAGLALDEVCLPEYLRGESSKIRTALLGKWHLSGAGHGVDHARKQGFEHFRGTISNVGHRGAKKLKSPYFHYEEVVDGKEQTREAYATTAVTDDTLSAIKTFGDAQWFVVASYHAAHGPLHAPPEELRTIELSGTPKQSRHSHFAAMVEALDHEVGRLWDSLPGATRARTTIIIVGDNGGASAQMPEALRLGGPEDRALAGKGSLGESGILVPLIVAGAGVSKPGRVVPHLVNTTDLFDTTVELALGAPPKDTPDSVSLGSCLSSADAPPLREWIFSERFHRTNKNTGVSKSSRLAIRDARYKLVEDSLGDSRRFYDLENDPRESKNLFKGEELDEAATAALARLTAVLDGALGKDREAALATLK